MKLSSKKGFTLLDVVVALVVFAVGFASLAKLFSPSNLSSGKRMMSMEAVFLAQDKMEEIMAKKAASGYSAVSTANFPTAAENIIRNGATAFTRTTTITEVAESDFTTVSVGSGYKKVVVTVAWSSGGGGSRYLQTIFANY